MGVTHFRRYLNPTQWVSGKIKRQSRFIEKMSISGSDLRSNSFVLKYESIYFIIGISCIVGFVLLGWLKVTYGTFFFGEASKQWKKNVEVRKRYEDLFNTRSNLMYHISWSKSRGERDQAKQLMKELDKIDKVKCVFLSKFALE